VKTTKPIVGTFQHSNHQILGGKAKIFRVPKSGNIYQFQMWIEAEKKYLRKTLKTKDLETAILRADKLCMDTYSGISIGKKIFGILGTVKSVNSEAKEGFYILFMYALKSIQLLMR
jgi:hypothetical protein